MQADLEMLHAITPTKAEMTKFERELSAVRRVSGKSDDEDTQELKAAIELATKELADVLTPDPEDEAHFKSLSRTYEHDAKEAKEDAECYEDKIRAHFRSAEWYERAQLAAEIGIVVASVTLLLGSRIMWYVALVFGIGCAGIMGETYLNTARSLDAAEKKIAEAEKRTDLIEAGEEAAGGQNAAPATSGSAIPKKE